MSEDIRMPNFMCNFCINFVLSVIDFKAQCLKSEKLLNDMLKTEIDSNDNDKDDELANEIEEIESIHSDFPENPIQTNDIKLICDICNKTFRQPKQLAKHRTLKHGIEDFIKCKQCKHVFQNNKQLENHMKRHEKTCNECGKNFVSAFKLNRHKIVHQRKRQTHFCRFCIKPFTRTDTLQEHIKRTHSEQPRPKPVCNICGKSVYNVNHHMKQKHTLQADRPFPCNICDKAFAFKSILQKHVEIVHDVENKDKFDQLCNVCGKRFRTKGELKTHMDIHSVDRKHVCGECGKKYKTYSALWRHERVHTGAKPFVCTYCSKAFISKIILTNHVRTHTGEKPYKCNICSRAFSVLSTLNTHKKLVHGS